MIDPIILCLLIGILIMIGYFWYVSLISICITPDREMRRVIDDLMIKYDAASEKELITIALAMMDSIVHHRMDHKTICTQDQFGYVEPLELINDLDRRGRGA